MCLRSLLVCVGLFFLLLPLFAFSLGKVGESVGGGEWAEVGESGQGPRKSSQSQEEDGREHVLVYVCGF